MRDQNPYIQALARVPAGSTRSFAALAALAGRASAARAAGRAVASIPDEDRRPWQRIVDASGGFAPIPERARVQLERLRAERARPRAGESVLAWARRVRASWIGDWRRRVYMPRDDERVSALPPERVEAFASRAEAEACGFKSPEANEPAKPRRAARGPEPSIAPRASFDSKAGKSTRSPTSKLSPRLPAQSPQATKSTRTTKSTPTAESTHAAKDLASGACTTTASAPRVAHATEPSFTSGKAARARLDCIDWDRVRNEALFQGAAVVPNVLDDDDTAALRRTFEDDEQFERTIEMAPRGYGIGRYRYLREPIPTPAALLRERLYGELRSIASGVPGAVEYPPDLERFFERCQAAGQKRASSILLRYERGGINHPHRDIYGAEWFPFQALVVLSRRGVDFDGGEFELHERARGGARVTRPFPLDRGDLCVFASKCFSRPEAGAARWTEVEHGMSPVTRGERLALGLVLHLAE